MLRSVIGDIGHLAVITAFVAAAVATFGYFKSSSEKSLDTKSWKRFARIAFYIHGISILTAITVLYIIIGDHYYEYNYARSHSSDRLPLNYLAAALWEGQEGSFLLWMFWHVIIGFILIRIERKREAPVMSVFSLVQLILTSMIIGVAIFDVKIGSSPFILLREAMPNMPVFQLNPDYIPEDGAGLNPLLQNYWMVIHPPTLFLGFALVLVPFSYCVAGLRKKDYKGWLKPAMPWLLLAVLILGTGIIMGAYWAYETLNFGGYWNWDPVENAVLIPWLVLVAGLHTAILASSGKSGLRITYILIAASFTLILYSTFLTRSGILGDTSVHSFTDLGLSGQLLFFNIIILLLFIFLYLKRRKHIPVSGKELKINSKETLLFSGTTVLCLAAFQILVMTSVPVYNALAETFGLELNLAGPSDPPAFYGKFQLWFAVCIAVLSALGQVYWWKINKKRKLRDVITIPFIFSLLLSGLIIIFSGIRDFSYITLLVAAVFSVVVNTGTAWSLTRSDFKLSGGAVAHIGIALMLIGILFSSGYSKVISLNNSGLAILEDFTEDQNLENIVLHRHESVPIEGYELTYYGQFVRAKNFPGLVDKTELIGIPDPYKAVARRAITYQKEVRFEAGDTLEINPELLYFKVGFTKSNGKSFILFPKVHMNPGAEGIIASPALRMSIKGDLYAHVTGIPKVNEEKNWGETKTIHRQIGDTIIINDYIALLENIESVKDDPEVKLTQDEVLLRLVLRVKGKEQDFLLYPKLLLGKEGAWSIPEIREDLGMKVTLQHFNPQGEESPHVRLDINTAEKDWIVFKVIEKPFINILWIGTFLVIIGTGTAVVRRFKKRK